MGSSPKIYFGHDVATIRREGPDLKPFLDRLRGCGPPREETDSGTGCGPDPPAVGNGLFLKPAGIFPVTLTSLQNTFDQYPSVVEKALLEIEIYDSKERLLSHRFS